MIISIRAKLEEPGSNDSDSEQMENKEQEAETESDHYSLVKKM